MKNEFTESASKLEKLDLIELSPQVQNQFLDVLECMLLSAEDSGDRDAIMIAIKNLKSSMS